MEKTKSPFIQNKMEELKQEKELERKRLSLLMGKTNPNPFGFVK